MANESLYGEPQRTYGQELCFSDHSCPKKLFSESYCAAGLLSPESLDLPPSDSETGGKKTDEDWENFFPGRPSWFKAGQRIRRHLKTKGGQHCSLQAMSEPTSDSMMPPSPSSLLVVGAGELGCRVAHKWKDLFPKAKVYLKVRRSLPERAERWAKLGFSVAGEGDRAENVVFCAPPSDGYESSMRDAIQRHWDKKGNFVFTSSGGVYSENSGGEVDEESAVKEGSDYHDGILGCERAVVDSGGTVLRLGGLYHLRRGAHNYWVCSGKSPFASSPDGLINLIHYDDAADAVLCALKEKPGGEEGRKRQLYLVTDGVPISRKEICAAARRNPSFSSLAEPEFQGSGLDGKRYIVSRGKEELGWTPKHKSFSSFMLESFASEAKVPLLQRQD